MTNDGQVQGSAPEDLLQALVLDGDLERLEDLLAEFNLFDVLGVARSEKQHSALLAWLLDPRGSHGLRDYFLRGFLAEAGVEARDREIPHITPLIVDGWQLENVEVATERHRIDVLVIAPGDRFVCLIENKIGSSEHSDQLDRYLSTVEREYGEFVRFPIYLTPNGDEPESEKDAERYVALDYGKVAELVDRVLRTRGSTMSSRVASFLEQFARTLRRHVLPTTDNIDELAYQIYSNHREAIDLIVGARSTPGNMAWDIIERAIKQFAPDLQPDQHHLSRGMRRYFAPSLDEIPELRKGWGWTESNRMLLFEFKYLNDEEIWLFLMMSPGPQPTRECLYRLQQEGEAPFRNQSGKLAKRHHWIYRKSLLGKRDYERFDPRKIRSKLEKAITDFYVHDYPVMVNAIRVEFGCSPVSFATAAEATHLS